MLLRPPLIWIIVACRRCVAGLADETRALVGGFQIEGEEDGWIRGTVVFRCLEYVTKSPIAGPGARVMSMSRRRNRIEGALESGE